ncbi:MAG TPA: glycoside hydrolase family 95 protein [Arsenicitalea sp.]|nr:glycoside hydrolase family 95 protein [Arsenicitalea sp.]
MTDLELWYCRPAVEWTEALPIGNGRLGAMVFGGVAREELQLNESTFWAGGPYSPINPEALGHLAEVRELIFAGRFAEAEVLGNQYLMAKPHLQMSYQPIGDLWLDFGHGEEVTDYRRALDLDTAITTTEFVAANVAYRREAFSSAADGVIVLRLSADKPNSVSFVLRLDSPQDSSVATFGTTALQVTGTNRGEHGIAGAMRFAARAMVLNRGGRVAAEGSTLRIDGADDVVILVDAATNFVRYDDISGDPIARIDTRLAAAGAKSFEALRDAHLAEHRRLFRRLAIDLGPAVDLPTDERVARFAEGNDPSLAALYLQYGRYLMISSSRPGTQPGNLQGIWNKEIVPPWGSKYTANINLQMIHWLPDAANLAECMDPLIEMAEDLSVTGAAMAQGHYGAPGWVMHHNTDLWRATGPVDGAKWGLWPTGGAWLSAQLWDHSDYSGDKALLARLYPVLKGAAEFLLAVLVPLPGTDLLVTNPSLSPENVHPHGAALCAGPAMDNQIARDLFSRVIDAAARLGVDAGFRDRLQAALVRLPPDRIGKAGQLQEWLEDWDLEAPEIHHRHVSHLYGVYPSWQINRDDTPELVAAAQKSLEIRGDEATGWGIGWRLNLWARLRDGAHAHDVLTLLLSPERTYPNLFDAHPPFQIDGNFGGAAGIIEMLVQSQPGVLHLLPALPPQWSKGSIMGVRARGGLELDLTWDDGRLDHAELRASRDVSVDVRYGGVSLSVELSASGSRRITFPA